MFCSNCGAPNSEGARFCQKCGAALVGNAAAAGVGVGGPTMPATGMPQQLPPQLGYQAAPGGARFAVDKSPGIALLLSFLIPGVGQFYCGESKKGGIMLAVYFLSWMTAFIVIGWFGLAVVWIWSMIDAYNIASGKTPLSS
jgi:TM2 domain-containing membrane protein YozV